MSKHSIVTTGSPTPMGSHWDGNGVNFAVFSHNAERVELCVFDPSGNQEIARHDLPARDGDTWHGRLEGAGPGLIYGYRVYGPYAPREGHRFNPNKLLIDPYSRGLHGTFAWNDAVHGYRVGDAQGDSSFDERDSAPHVPRSVVVAPLPDAGRPPRPRTPWADTVLYELHVRGFTRLHPEVPERLRGTVAALAEPCVIAHLHALGVTTIELLPVAAFLDELPLVRRGLRNYWGYNPIAPFAMHAPYLADGDVAEFARTIDRLHEAGIEVVLDVVLNHSAEGDETGPTLAYRGLDNALYYRLQPDRRDRSRDDTGCGNTLDFSQPPVVALMHAALRYWACEIGVDGFRFDLAPVLARDRAGAFDPRAPLLSVIADDPDLRDLKLIVEPWDLGAPGHFLGGFEVPFAEWNDRYRDGVRRFWRGDARDIGEFATRFAGSSDVFAASGRPPSASVNFVTAHDGFTLADLTAYAEKHNEANGEHNRDGTDANWSSNYGVEGGTDDVDVLARRQRLRRSLLATLLLSHGTPMLLAGDELSHTQHGNNNAYCQDGPLTWLDWSAQGDASRDLRSFVHRATTLRRALGLLRQQRYFDGRMIVGDDGRRDIAWLRTDGGEMTGDDWRDPTQSALGILLTGVDDCAHEQLFLALNSGEQPLRFQLPSARDPDGWIVALDSNAATDIGALALHANGSEVTIAPGALLALVPRRTPILGVPLALSARAHEAGVLDTYGDIDGTLRQVPADALEKLIAAATDGMVAKHSGETAPESATPAQCFLPAGLSAPPGRWALSAQLYGLRSEQGWGIGDFADLAKLIDIAAAAGADGILLSPVHALSLGRPHCASPYAPGSRLLLNPLLVSVPMAAGDDPPPAYRAFVDDGDVRAQRARLDALPMIDYPAVAALKLRAFSLLHRAFRDEHLGATPSARGEAFLRFVREEGMPLRNWAVFEALGESFARQDHRHVPWMEWPSAFRDPHSDAVAAFEQENGERMQFLAWLQWHARLQWRHAATRARAAGMQTGLIADLALGTDLDSAEAWQWPGLVAHAVELGAPPDAFAPKGQSWGSPPWKPRRLAELHYAPFDALLDAAMRDAGAIRLDHVMGQLRQFWIPRGCGADHGGYVAYPFETLLRRLAEASQRHRCAVIGEDLGNVPAGFRARLQDARILGYRVVYFQREADGNFLPPSGYEALTATAVSTHDLPTIAGFRAGSDIDARDAKGLFVSPAQSVAAREERLASLVALEAALADFANANVERDGFADALHRFLAASGSRLAIVQIEDVLGLRDQANLPGLGDEEPNWRRRLPLTLEALASDVRVRTLAEIFAGRATGQGASRPESV